MFNDAIAHLRYVAYYEWMKSHGRVLPEAVPLRLTQIQITGELNIIEHIMQKECAKHFLLKIPNNLRSYVLWPGGRFRLLCGSGPGGNK